MNPGSSLQLLRTARRIAVTAGVSVALCAGAAVSRITIDLPGSLGVEFGSAPQRVVRLELFMSGKDIDAVLVTSIARNPALAGWDARDVTSTLRWNGASLSGMITATIVPAGPGDPWPWKCVVEGAWKDGGIDGRANSFMGSRSASGVGFSAKAVKLSDLRLDEGFVELILPGSGRKPGVHAGIEFRGGRAVASASFGPRIHPVWEKMDLTAFALKRGRISGKIAWLPADAGEDGVPAAPEPVEILANLRDGFAAVKREGGTGVALLTGLPKLGDRTEIELAFDAPLVGGERWRRRVVVRLEVSRREVRATAFFNGRANPDWNAVIDGATFENRNGRITGAIQATIASGSVQPGVYRIRFEGDMVGTWIAGTFESELAGTKVQDGQFTGWAATPGA